MNRKRRNFLKTSGASALSIGLMGLMSEETQSLGTVNFIEVALTNEIQSDIGSDEHLSKKHVDQPIYHYVDGSNDILYHFEGTPDRALIASRRGESLVFFRGYSSSLQGITEGSTRALVTGTGNNARMTEAVMLANRHPLPSVSLSKRGEEVSVTADTATTEVSGWAHDSVQLRPQRKTCKTYRHTEADPETESELLDMGFEPHEIGQPKEYGTAEVEVQPTLEVTNYGELEAIDATDRRTVPR